MKWDALDCSEDSPSSAKVCIQIIWTDRLLVLTPNPRNSECITGSVKTTTLFHTVPTLTNELDISSALCPPGSVESLHVYSVRQNFLQIVSRTILRNPALLLLLPKVTNLLQLTMLWLQILLAVFRVRIETLKLASTLTTPIVKLRHRCSTSTRLSAYTINYHAERSKQ